MQSEGLSWFCARTKPKHEHIAAANVHKNLGLEVFHPRLRINRPTRRGTIRVIEPLFPCYIFVRCVLADQLNEIRYTTGVSTIVHFGLKTPTIPDSVIADLQQCFGLEEMMTVEDCLRPGDDVVVAEGAFLGMRASVLRVLPAKQRVQILLEVLGRPTTVEVNRNSVALENGTMADRVPLVAVPQRQLLGV